MFPSRNYFATVDCPFFENGACERPYCNFRHRKEETPPVTDNAHKPPLNLPKASATLGLANAGQGGLALEQLVSEALQMVLSESKHLFDSLDTEQMKQLILQSQSLATTASSAVEKAVQSLTTPSSSSTAKPKLTSSKYALPPNAPKYTPTPIALLGKTKPISSHKPQLHSELTYIPTTVKPSPNPAPILAYTPTCVSKSTTNPNTRTSPPAFPLPVTQDPKKVLETKSGPNQYESSASHSRTSEDSASLEDSYIPPGLRRSSIDYIPSKGNSMPEASYTPLVTKENAQIEATYFPSNIQNLPEPSYIPAGYSPAVDYKPTNNTNALEPSYIPDSPTKPSANYLPSGKLGPEPGYSPMGAKDKPLPATKYVPTIGSTQSEETYSPARVTKSNAVSSKEVSPESYLAQLEGEEKEKKSSGSSSRHNSSHRSSSARHKSSKSKDRDKDKRSHSSHSSKSKHSSSSSSHKSSNAHKSKHKDKEQKGEREQDKPKKSSEKRDLEPSEDSASPSHFPDDLEGLEAALAEMNGDVDDECYRIFQEFQATEVETKEEPKLLHKDKRNSELDAEEVIPTKKQRTAHENATGQRSSSQTAPPTRKSKLSPGMIMLERLKRQQEIIQQQKQALEAAVAAKDKLSEPKLPESKKMNARTPAPPSFALQGPNKRRIAHVPNVASLLQNNKVAKTTSPSKPTTSTSNSGNKPATSPATPRQTTLPRPIIPTDFGSKVPASIRQRYLNILVDECLKFYTKEQEAYDRALAEEQNCYARSSNRNVYLNVVVNCVKKIRTEASSKGGDSSSDLASTSGSNAKVSHLSILAGKGGTKGSWSIEKPKKSIDTLTGGALYQFFTRYLLKEDQLDTCGYPRPDPNEKGKALVTTTYFRGKINNNKSLTGTPKNQRTCDRCNKIYYVDSKGLPLREETCVFHWGRIFTFRGQSQYSCCKGEQNSEGCEVSKYHITESFDPDNLRGYIATFSKPAAPDGNYGIFALDCEMCYTTEGNELTRVTVIDTQCKTVYETLVKPDHPLLDCNTRFSGITEDDLKNVKTTLRDVQATLLSMFSDKTILIGHSLDSDLRALKLIHKTVIDTSIVFPHKMGLPYRRALRNLCIDYLKKLIQNDEGGHDSAEDAIACMELMFWKMKEDLKTLR
nr:EOG090X01LQ [Triops cancriformis]